MVFCGNCGREMEDGAQFCGHCGAAAGQAVTAQRPQTRTGLSEEIEKYIQTAIADGMLEQQEIDLLRRKATEWGDDPDLVEMTVKAELAQKKQASAPESPSVTSVKVGQVKKCPACGAPVESFQTRCASCGHELNNQQVSGAIKEFVDQINAVDVEIAYDRGNYKQGWSSWGTGKKILWVILNIYTCLIPLLVGKIANALFPKLPPLTPAEQKKKSLIENFVVPNNREDIMEFVLFSSLKIENQIENAGISISELGIANRWAKVWSDKCKQLSTRAGIVLVDDTKTMSIINGLMDKPKQLITRAKKRVLIRNGILAAVIMITVILLVRSCFAPAKAPVSATVPADENAAGNSGQVEAIE